MITHEISVDTKTRGIALRQLKGPGITSRIPNTTSREAIDVPINFHVHCRQMLPALFAILITVFGAGSARVSSPRPVVREALAVPAIRVVNVVTQACCICVAIGHGEAQAGISRWILLCIWIRTVRRGTRELDRLGDALARVSSQIDSSALQRGGVRHVAPIRVADKHLEARVEGYDCVGSFHRRAGKSVMSGGFAMQ